LESRLGSHQYASSGAVDVAEGLCIEAPVHLRDYGFSGRLIAGISRYVTVKLVSTDGTPTEVQTDSIEPDGTFYFRNVHDGEYLLTVTSWVEGAKGEFFYPGTFDRKKATKRRIANSMPSTSLNFDPRLLPLVPIPVAIQPSTNASRFSWNVQLESSNYIRATERWTPGLQVVNVYGLRGGSYSIELYGYSYHPADYGDCRSERVPVTADSGLSTVHIAIPAHCP
jgi:hypothetical protein